MNIKVSGKVPGKCVGNVVINVVKKEASSTGIWENMGSSLSVPPGLHILGHRALYTPVCMWLPALCSSLPTKAVSVLLCSWGILS